MRRLVLKIQYARTLFTLMAGTSLARAVPIAISPISTAVDFTIPFNKQS